MGAEASRGESNEESLHHSIELNPDIEEEAKRISASVKDELGEGKRICILGDEPALTSAEASELVRILARDLPPVVGQRGMFIVDGEAGVQQLFAQNCGAGCTLWNLVPEGSEVEVSSSSTRSLHVGRNIEETKAALVCLGELFITVGGGLTIAKQAHHAQELGSALLPIRRTGGASSGKHGFPECALQKPAWIDEETWRQLSDDGAQIAEIASAVVSAVRSWLISESGESGSEAANTRCWLQQPSVGTWCMPLLARPRIAPEVSSPTKRKGVSALLKGLRSGEVSKIVDKMEAKVEAESTNTMEPTSPAKESTKEPPFVPPFEWRSDLEDAVQVADKLAGKEQEEANEFKEDEASSPVRLPTASMASVDSLGSTSSLFKLAPPPPPSSSVRSPAASQKVIAFEELVDVVAPPPVASVTSPKAAPMEANLSSVAAALNVGPPPSLGGVEPKVKAFVKRELSNGADQENSDEDTNQISIAAAVDADVDDEACETLLGGEQTLAYSGGVETPRRLPLGRMALGDGIDGSSEDEEVKSHKAGATTAVRPPKRPEKTTPGDEHPPSPPQTMPRGKTSPSPTSPPAAIVQPPIQGRDMADIDAQLTRTLDKFFDNDTMWQQVASEISNCPKLRASMEWLQAIVPSLRAQFRVQVPEPYPGIQYRKSKVMTDRYARYAKHGTVVTGHIEDGEWLKVTENVYLPMKVGAVEILKHIQPQELGREPHTTIPQRGGLVATRAEDEKASKVNQPNPHSVPMFTDSPRAEDANVSPLRLVSDPTQRTINPFSDTPPGSPRATPMRTRPNSTMN